VLTIVGGPYRFSFSIKENVWRVVTLLKIKVRGAESRIRMSFIRNTQDVCVTKLEL
jgi:hypothetical protein